MPAQNLIAFPATGKEARAARARATAACMVFNSFAFADSLRDRYIAYLKILDREPDENTFHLSDTEILELFPMVKSPFTVNYGIKLSIGASAFIDHGCIISDNPVYPVTIGERTMISTSVQIHSVSYSSHLKECGTEQGVSLCGEVKIGNDVLIGGGAIITPGVTIGDGAMVGAGSVVMEDVPPRHVAVGNPAKVIRKTRPEVKGVKELRYDAKGFVLKETAERRVVEEEEVIKLRADLDQLQKDYAELLMEVKKLKEKVEG
ncbi:hypothetical protein H2198_003095 [Neophaeococcomyces mojaviensis]|uniref:Uncharacterized protein n=1 Tax=Neophaeococcomyces mojaviensis TaxID=3383035 RepID=A0ACC3ACD4_9EURO|nr:hypothetical protein H2198_003095 [Knufia sp. JES_112]